MRIDFEFVGTTSKAVSLDPEEFKGLSLREIADVVEDTLRSIAPGVSFFHDDIVLAAEQIAEDTREAAPGAE